MSQQEILNLNKLIDSLDFDEKLLGASILKELGKIGKRLYKICPEGEQKKQLAKHLINIKNKIESL